MKNQSGIKCRAFQHRFPFTDDATLLQGYVNGQLRWMMIRQCNECGVYRTDTMMPRTCERVSTHYDKYPDDYDKEISAQEARKKLIKEAMKKNRSN